MKIGSLLLLSIVLSFSQILTTMAAEINQHFSVTSASSSSSSSSASSTVISSNTVNVTANSSDGGSFASVSISKADLRYPHLLRISTDRGIERAEVKINGKLVKSIVNESQLEVDLAPLMPNVGRYEVEISGTVPLPTDTVSVKFIGKNSKIDQQSSGNYNLDRKIVIDVR
jgi:hypothetical protein